MMRCRTVIAATTIGSAAATACVAFLCPEGWHWLLAPGGIVVGVLEARIISQCVRGAIRRAEERGAHDALTEVVRLGATDPRWAQVSRRPHAAD